jgi:sensor domain CHASE-containing protein
LKELKRVIQTAHGEHEDISSQLATARAEKEKANRRYSSWDKGFLLKKIFNANFAKRQLDSETADAEASTG